MLKIFFLNQGWQMFFLFYEIRSASTWNINDLDSDGSQDQKMLFEVYD